MLKRFDYLRKDRLMGYTIEERCGEYNQEILEAVWYGDANIRGEPLFTVTRNVDGCVEVKVLNGFTYPGGTELLVEALQIVVQRNRAKERQWFQAILPDVQPGAKYLRVKLEEGSALLLALSAWDEGRLDKKGRVQPLLELFHGCPIAKTKAGWPIFKCDLDRVTASWAVLGPIPPEKSESLAAALNAQVLENPPRYVGFHTDG